MTEKAGTVRKSRSEWRFSLGGGAAMEKGQGGIMFFAAGDLINIGRFPHDDALHEREREKCWKGRAAFSSSAELKVVSPLHPRQYIGNYLHPWMGFFNISCLSLFDYAYDAASAAQGRGILSSSTRWARPKRRRKHFPFFLLLLLLFGK